MNVKLLLLGILIFPTFVLAQNPFNKTFGYPSSDEGFVSISMHDSIQFIIAQQSNYGTMGPVALFLNENGDSVHSYTEFTDCGWAAGYHHIGNQNYVTTGGYYIASNNTQDVLLQIVNYSSSISPLLKRFGGSDLDFGWDIQILADSGFLIAGTTKSYGAGDYDVYLVRTDKNGDSLWTRTYGNSRVQQAKVIEKVNDSVCLVIGEWEAANGSYYGPFAIKISVDGDTLMYKHYEYQMHIRNISSMCRTNDGCTTNLISCSIFH